MGEQERITAADVAIVSASDLVGETEPGYALRTLQSVRKNCAARRIVGTEQDELLAALAERYGKPVAELDDRNLKLLNRELPRFIASYLEGKKRRTPAEARARLAADEATKTGA